MKMQDHKPLQHLRQITHLKNIHTSEDRRKREKENGRMEFCCRDNHLLLEIQEKSKLHLKTFLSMIPLYNEKNCFQRGICYLQSGQIIIFNYFCFYFHISFHLNKPFRTTLPYNSEFIPALTQNKLIYLHSEYCHSSIRLKTLKIK